MLKVHLQQIAAWTQGRVHGDDVLIRGVTTDSRKVLLGQLFVALVGERHDGHEHVAMAMEKGASAALVSRVQDAAVPQVVVSDTLKALGDMAAARREASSARVVGITGSNGKTTVKTLTAAILARHGRTHVNAGNFNNEIGMPLTLLAMPDDAEYAVLEMGAGKPGDIDYLAAIARPDIGLVNNIATAHLERMGSVENIAETKGAMYRALPDDGVGIVNADDAFADYFAGLLGTRRMLRFGLDREADVGAEILDMNPGGSRFVLSTPQGDAEIALPLPGRHNVANALAASAIACALDVPLEHISHGLHHAGSVPGRLRSRAMPGGWKLIDDSYNANPASTRAGIDTLGLAEGEAWLVLGDMAELGPEGRELHARIGAYAREHGVTRLLGVGLLTRAACEAFGSGGEHFSEQSELIEVLRRELRAGVTCLIKGSRSAGMDRVVAALEADEQQGGTHAS
ncbi:UDP-N-acetylmuramoyl-tripeptide--D-alanyl-D-alanine ligase [Oleiagrimonas soli]|uniref:UDP-N-acetylmuramoyl-tripeptide--D-alanyl-D-alanine ligase n=1 Tax=Oleiagrimonas soli TaxID=1543381 RepID=A0A099CVM6_9GAMM|nr:UDP-N-acetylmuramoyl-tripeptide--D-alanyl-D-alanine ligase [Oleiagrimonas soli]KGI77060.1 UDP-N-acetylmuramoyl-tripeptide--D-alanyl-D-alanine ligase [Oleiagrimonas soli]MBB6185410.1 UDP-N-acetylmuramoyl-tripeptide--D-alanyl-D-alanine ligase [Oleiagrimonas soli]